MVAKRNYFAEQIGTFVNSLTRNMRRLQVEKMRSKPKALKADHTDVRTECDMVRYANFESKTHMAQHSLSRIHIRSTPRTFDDRPHRALEAHELVAQVEQRQQVDALRALNELAHDRVPREHDRVVDRRGELRA